MPKKLLLIEDNEMESSQIARFLENEDLLEIRIASTGKEGSGADQEIISMIASLWIICCRILPEWIS